MRLQSDAWLQFLRHEINVFQFTQLITMILVFRNTKLLIRYFGKVNDTDLLNKQQINAR